MKIYVITNTVNDKKYVGCTIATVNSRWADHRAQAKRGSPFALHRAMRAYGFNTFKVQEVMHLNDETEMLLMESAYIAELESFGPKGYNMTFGGEGGTHTVTDVIRERMRTSALRPLRRAQNSAMAKKLWQNREVNVAKISAGNLRRFQDPVQRAQRAESQRALWQQPEYRAAQLVKLAEARRLRSEQRRVDLP